MDKLSAKHGLTVEECRQAFTEDADRMAVWTREKARTYRRRVQVVGRTRAGRLLVGYLYPTEDPDAMAGGDRMGEPLMDDEDGR